MELEQHPCRCYLVAMLQRLKSEKPWAKLRITRKQYETTRPWMKSGVGRKQFEAFVLEIPDDAVDALYREADAEKLVEALFGVKTED